MLLIICRERQLFIVKENKSYFGQKLRVRKVKKLTQIPVRTQSGIRNNPYIGVTFITRSCKENL